MECLYLEVVKSNLELSRICTFVIYEYIPTRQVLHKIYSCVGYLCTYLVNGPLLYISGDYYYYYCHYYYYHYYYYLY
jgi:hypothetical protein